MIINCPDCDFDIEDDLNRCPYCGCRLNESSQENTANEKINFNINSGCNSSCWGCLVFSMAVVLIINFLIQLIF